MTSSFLLCDFLFPLDLIHLFTDNRMDTAKSRTSEDILRSSRLSAYSPEPYTQSESDYYPYTSSPKGRKWCHFRDFRIATCKRSCIFCFPLEQIQTPKCSSFCDCVVTIIHSATLLLCSTLGSTFVQGHLFYLFSLSAYRMPRRRFSTGGDEESWSHGLQRVRASLFFLSVLLKHLIEESHLHPINNALPMVWHPNYACFFLKMCFFLYLTFTVH